MERVLDEHTKCWMRRWSLKIFPIICEKSFILQNGKFSQATKRGEIYDITYRSTVCRSPIAPAEPYTVPTGLRTTMVYVRALSGCRFAACKSDRCFRQRRVAEFRPPRCWTASALCRQPRSELQWIINTIDHIVLVN